MGGDLRQSPPLGGGGCPATAATRGAGLNTMVKVTIKGMQRDEIVECVAGAKLRPWIVARLLEHLRHGQTRPRSKKA